jgi:hypothetical protein
MWNLLVSRVILGRWKLFCQMSGRSLVREMVKSRIGQVVILTLRFVRHFLPLVLGMDPDIMHARQALWPLSHFPSRMDQEIVETQGFPPTSLTVTSQTPSWSPLQTVTNHWCHPKFHSCLTSFVIVQLFLSDLLFPMFLATRCTYIKCWFLKES